MINTGKKELIKFGVSATMGLGANTLVKTVAQTLVPPELGIPTRILCSIGTRAMANVASKAAFENTMSTCNAIDYIVQYTMNEISEGSTKD